MMEGMKKRFTGGGFHMSLQEKIYKNGEEIIKEGDIGKSFFLLTEGKAGVYSNYEKNNPFRIAVIEPGEYFGEMAILEAYPRSASVIAIGNVHAIEIPAGEMNLFFEENPEQVLELITHLGNRILAMTDDYNESQKLLKEVRASETDTKSESFFSKIKKHISLYQSNKNSLTEPNADALRADLSAAGETDSFQKGTVIFKEGDEGDCMFLLRNGSVGLYNGYGTSESLKSAELEAVSVFGEDGLTSSDGRSVTAVAESDSTRVEVIYKEDLDDIVSTSPAKVNLILRCLSYRLRRLNIDFLKNCKEITETYNK